MSCGWGPVFCHVNGDLYSVMWMGTCILSCEWGPVFCHVDGDLYSVM